ncbi:Proline--tRNA ligase [Geodia barretti]|uniref:Probable proline--tRNA ligase, mitochondrial n=1 Tax=Geodia barretti TaxID=519541 RepID=A0AA35R4S5_GEOBA|nr:Proline--tRNA ligase [Geodia barretti]
MLSRTLRSDPSEAETASHRLMLRAGLIQQVAAGVYSYLPLAWRSLKKIENIIREEMDAAGGQELMLPALQPMDLWEQTGRRAAFGDNLFSLQDRSGRAMVMAPTHEEVITNVVKSNVQSYRDLPQLLYQIQTKFRDEPRPRAGLVRVREFDMKDAYSFNADDASLDDTYQDMAQAYRNIFRRCGLPVLMAQADSGAIGGKDSHEFLLPTDTGEDTVITCSGCDYVANAEKAESVYPPVEREAEAPLREVATPGIKTIAGLAEFVGVPESKTLKAVFYMADGEPVFVTIRGDLEVNEVKLKNALHCADLRFAEDEEVDLLTDIALAQPGLLCAQCGGILEATRGVEVGHIFKLGTFFSETLGANYLDAEGRNLPITMGCYGIGVGRLLAAAIEQNHDDQGIVFPHPIAPYQAHLVGLNLSNEEVAAAGQNLYDELNAAGIETLYDDRPDAAAGVKFNDADLMGLPVRLVISPRNLNNGVVEVRGREESDAVTVPLAEVAAAVRSRLAVE